jgi:hypothetical protein
MCCIGDLDSWFKGVLPIARYEIHLHHSLGHDLLGGGEPFLHDGIDS